MKLLEAKTLPRDRKLLLVTATPIEAQAVILCFDPDRRSDPMIDSRKPYRWLCRLGTYDVFTITAKEMGASSAQNLANSAFNELDPGLLIAVGIAFGAGRDGQTIGDLLIASHVQGYDVARVEPDLTITFRQGTLPASGALVHKFVDRKTHGRPHQWAGAWPSIHIGTLLSGSKLIDNIDYRNSLLLAWPTAIGGEMEAIGLASAAEDDPFKREWTIVKGICDWASGKNTPDKDLYQKVAAWNAALCVRAMFDLEGLRNLKEPDYVRDFTPTPPPPPHLAQPQAKALATTPPRAPPSAASLAGRATTVSQLCDAVEALFKRPQLKVHTFIDMNGAVPQQLSQALNQPDPSLQGEGAVEAVIGIAEALLKAVARDGLVVPLADRPSVREALFLAMGLAAKLGINLDLVPGMVDGDTYLVVPAVLPEGATLGLRKTPHKCWVWDLSGGLPRLRDQHIVEVPIELGEGQPRIDAMNRLAYKSIAVGGFVPAEISPQALMRLRGELNNLRKQGRTQCFMLTDESVASPDLREWARQFRTCLIVLKPSDGLSMYLLDEDVLVGRVQYFVGLFNDKDWPQ